VVFQQPGRDMTIYFVVVDRFNKMCILMPCKNTIKGQEVTNMFFEQVGCTLGYQGALWENMDTKLKRYTTFHPQTNGKTEVVNRDFGSTFEGLQSEASKDLWDENLDLHSTLL
jgi:hypothetical protein